MKISRGRKLLILAVIIILAIIAAGSVIPFALPKRFTEAQSGILNIFTRPYFYLGKLPVTPSFLIEALLFLIVLTLFSRLFQKFLQKEVLIHTPWDRGQQYAVARVLSYAFFLFGLLIGLQSVGLDLSSLAVVGGALGVGAGFGLQPIVSNFVSGLVLLTERPIRLGDRVEVGSTYGDVVRIGGRSTWIRTNDNEVIIVPNSEFVTSRVINWTANDQKVRFSIAIGVSYNSDPEQIRELLLEIARRHPDVLTEPAPDVIFVEFADSSLNFELRVFTEHQVQTPSKLKSDLLFAIFKTFSEHGIEIPFPQRDLHLKSLPGSAPLLISNLSDHSKPGDAPGSASAGNSVA
jgi:small-conductance mechanosensitive channel